MLRARVLTGGLCLALACADDGDNDDSAPGDSGPGDSSGSATDDDDDDDDDGTTGDDDEGTTSGEGSTAGDDLLEGDGTTAGADDTVGTGDESQTRCLSEGELVATPIGVDGVPPVIIDLKLFFDPDTPGMASDETLLLVPGAGDQRRLAVAARAEGSGEGHEGLGFVELAPDGGACGLGGSGTVPFASDAADFGTLDVTWTADLAVDAAELTLVVEGGAMDLAPVTYVMAIAGE